MERRKPLRSSSFRGGGRKPLKRKQPKRDWSDARAKVEAEGSCRMGSFACSGKLEAAHVIGRAHDDPSNRAGDRYVDPDSIVPLCTVHHRAYDAHTFDLLPVLSLDEQLRAVRDAGGIALALRRISGRNYGQEAA